MPESVYDIAIVGGGPAGLAAALAAKDAGTDSVCVIEKRASWGIPVQCGEFVPKLLTRVLPVSAECVAQRIDEIRLFHCGELLREVRAPGFLLHRDVWERQLADRARSKGIHLLQPARASAVGPSASLEVVTADAKQLLSAAVLIGCDGPRSEVRDAVGASRPEFAVGLQHVLPLHQPLPTADLHFDPRYGAGYAWCFPKGEVANVGLALDWPSRGSLRQYFDEFVDRLQAARVIADGAAARRTGGLIPVSPPTGATVADRLLLAGDAAGHANSLTGAGLYPAVVCGQMAGEAAARAARRSADHPLQRYEAQWRALLGDYLTQAHCARQRLARCAPHDHAREVARAWRL